MKFSQWPRSAKELLILVLLMLGTTAVFWLTDLDIDTAARFYHPEDKVNAWPSRHWWLWEIFFDGASPVIVSAAVLAALVVVVSYFQPKLQRWRRQCVYVLLVIAIGPGLVVNLVFKDHWGRPRPTHIHEFGGEYQYIPPLQLGHTPDKSFVCGHCSVGYSVIVLYFLAQHYKLLYLGITLFLAGMMGYSRMAAGGHFFSDVLWSGYLVFLVAYLLYYGWYCRGETRRDEIE